MSEFVLADRMQGMSGNFIREILKLTQKPEVISLAGGLPSAESFPVDELRSITHDLFEKADADFLQYGTTEGLADLRTYLADFVKDVGIETSPENVLTLTGSQQGIDLACKALLNPGDVVLVERPTYLAALQIFRVYQAKVVAIPGDEDGMDLASLEAAAAKHKAKMVYCIPTFQNPSGIAWSLERRQGLAKVAERQNLVILEDDPYGRLRYSGEPVPAVTGLDNVTRSIYMGSFSKIVSPGLRVGYAVAPPEILRAMVIGKQGTDVHTSNLSQAIVAELFRRNGVARHIPVICEQYGKKRDTMLAALAEHFPQEATWTHPDGGLFVWVTLPQSLSTTKLLEEAVTQNVAFIPGTPFYVDGNGDNNMRLNFSNSSHEEIATGIKRIGQVIAQHL